MTHQQQLILQSRPFGLPPSVDAAPSTNKKKKKQPPIAPSPLPHSSSKKKKRTTTGKARINTIQLDGINPPAPEEVGQDCRDIVIREVLDTMGEGEGKRLIHHQPLHDQIAIQIQAVFTQMEKYNGLTASYNKSAEVAKLTQENLVRSISSMEKKKSKKQASFEQKVKKRQRKLFALDAELQDFESKVEDGKTHQATKIMDLKREKEALLAKANSIDSKVALLENQLLSKAVSLRDQKIETEEEINNVTRSLQKSLSSIQEQENRDTLTARHQLELFRVQVETLQRDIPRAKEDLSELFKKQESVDAFAVGILLNEVTEELFLPYGDVLFSNRGPYQPSSNNRVDHTLATSSTTSSMVSTGDRTFSHVPGSNDICLYLHGAILKDRWRCLKLPLQSISSYHQIMNLKSVHDGWGGGDSFIKPLEVVPTITAPPIMITPPPVDTPALLSSPMTVVTPTFVAATTTNAKRGRIALESSGCNMPTLSFAQPPSKVQRTVVANLCDQMTQTSLQESQQQQQQQLSFEQLLAVKIELLKKQMGEVMEEYRKDATTFDPNIATDLQKSVDFRRKYGFAVLKLDEKVSNGDHFVGSVGEPAYTEKVEKKEWNLNASVSPSTGDIDAVTAATVNLTVSNPISSSCSTGSNNKDYLECSIKCTRTDGNDLSITNAEDGVNPFIELAASMLRAHVQNEPQSASPPGGFASFAPNIMSQLEEVNNLAIQQKPSNQVEEDEQPSFTATSPMSWLGEKIMGTKKKDNTREDIELKQSVAFLVAAYVEDMRTYLDLLNLTKWNQGKLNIPMPKEDDSDRYKDLLRFQTLAAGLTDVELNEYAKLVYAEREMAMMELASLLDPNNNNNVASHDGTSSTPTPTREQEYVHIAANFMRRQENRGVNPISHMLTYLRDFVPTTLNPLSGRTDHSTIRKKFVEPGSTKKKGNNNNTISSSDGMLSPTRGGKSGGGSKKGPKGGRGATLLGSRSNGGRGRGSLSSSSNQSNDSRISTLIVSKPGGVGRGRGRGGSITQLSKQTTAVEQQSTNDGSAASTADRPKKQTRVRSDEKNKKRISSAPKDCMSSDVKGDMHFGHLGNDFASDTSWHPCSHSYPAWCVRVCALKAWVVGSGMADHLIQTHHQSGESLVDKLQVLVGDSDLTCEAQGFFLGHPSDIYAAPKADSIVNKPPKKQSTTSNTYMRRYGGKSNGHSLANSTSSASPNVTYRTITNAAVDTAATNCNPNSIATPTSAATATSIPQQCSGNNNGGPFVIGGDLTGPSTYPMEFFRNGRVWGPMGNAKTEYFGDKKVRRTSAPPAPTGGGDIASQPPTSVTDQSSSTTTTKTTPQNGGTAGLRQVLDVKPSIKLISECTGLPLMIDGLCVDPYDENADQEDCWKRCNEHTIDNCDHSPDQVKCDECLRKTATYQGIVALIGGHAIHLMMGLNRHDILKTFIECYHLQCKIVTKGDAASTTAGTSSEVTDKTTATTTVHQHYVPGNKNQNLFKMAKSSCLQLNKIIAKLPEVSIRVPSGYLCIWDTILPMGILRCRVDESDEGLQGFDGSTVTAASKRNCGSGVTVNTPTIRHRPPQTAMALALSDPNPATSLIREVSGLVVSKTLQPTPDSSANIEVETTTPINHNSSPYYSSNNSQLSWKKTELPFLGMGIFFADRSVIKKNGLLDDDEHVGVYEAPDVYHQEMASNLQRPKDSPHLHIWSGGVVQPPPVTSTTPFPQFYHNLSMSSDGPLPQQQMRRYVNVAPKVPIYFGKLSNSESSPSPILPINPESGSDCNGNPVTPTAPSVGPTYGCTTDKYYDQWMKRESRGKAFGERRFFAANNINSSSFSGVSMNKGPTWKGTGEAVGKLSSLYGLKQSSRRNQQQVYVCKSENMNVVKKFPYFGLFNSPCSLPTIICNLTQGISMTNMPTDDHQTLAYEATWSRYGMIDADTVHRGMSLVNRVRSGELVTYFTQGKDAKFGTLADEFAECMDPLNSIETSIYGSRFDPKYTPRWVESNKLTATPDGSITVNTFAPWLMMDMKVLHLEGLACPQDLDTSAAAATTAPITLAYFHSVVDENTTYFNQPALWNIRTGRPGPLSNPYYYNFSRILEGGWMNNSTDHTSTAPNDGEFVPNAIPTACEQALDHTLNVIGLNPTTSTNNMVHLTSDTLVDSNELISYCKHTGLIGELTKHCLGTLSTRAINSDGKLQLVAERHLDLINKLETILGAVYTMCIDHKQRELNLWILSRIEQIFASFSFASTKPQLEGGIRPPLGHSDVKELWYIAFAKLRWQMQWVFALTAQTINWSIKKNLSLPLHDGNTSRITKVQVDGITLLKGDNDGAQPVVPNDSSSSSALSNAKTSSSSFLNNMMALNTVTTATPQLLRAPTSSRFSLPNPSAPVQQQQQPNVPDIISTPFLLHLTSNTVSSVMDVEEGEEADEDAAYIEDNWF